MCIRDRGNALSLKAIEDEAVDVLMYYQILHHFSNEALLQVIETAYNKLDPNGYLVVLDTFNMEDHPWRKLAFNVIEPIYAMVSGRDKKAVNNYHNQPKDSFVAFMKACGFSLVQETGDRYPYVISEMCLFQKQK